MTKENDKSIGSLDEFKKKYPGLWEEILRLFGDWHKLERK